MLSEDPPAAILPAASMIVLRPGPGGGFEVLLTERAASVRNFAGALVFPGGKVEPGDEAIAEHSGFAAHWPKLAIQFIVEEAIASGIEDILIVTGKSKRPIEDHFDSNIELETHLRNQDKLDLLELVKPTNVNLFFVRQSYPLGLGHAVLQAKAFVGNEPFVVMLGDDIMDGEIPLTKQLIDVYEETHASNIAAS